MEEKKEELRDTPREGGIDAFQSVPESARGDANAVFRHWLSEGVVPADMYRRVTELFDLDPKAAEQFFGADFMDTVDYFTHYWG